MDFLLIRKRIQKHIFLHSADGLKKIVNLNGPNGITAIIKNLTLCDELWKQQEVAAFSPYNTRSKERLIWTKPCSLKP